MALTANGLKSALMTNLILSIIFGGSITQYLLWWQEWNEMKWNEPWMNHFCWLRISYLPVPVVFCPWRAEYDGSCYNIKQLNSLQEQAAVMQFLHDCPIHSPAFSCPERCTHYKVLSFGTWTSLLICVLLRMVLRSLRVTRASISVYDVVHRRKPEYTYLKQRPQWNGLRSPSDLKRELARLI